MGHDSLPRQHSDLLKTRALFWTKARRRLRITEDQAILQHAIQTHIFRGVLIGFWLLSQGQVPDQQLAGVRLVNVHLERFLNVPEHELLGTFDFLVSRIGVTLLPFALWVLARPDELFDLFFGFFEPWAVLQLL